MSIVKETVAVIHTLSVGAAAAAAVIEAASDVPNEVHILAGVVLLASKAIDAGIKAAQDAADSAKVGS